MKNSPLINRRQIVFLALTLVWASMTALASQEPARQSAQKPVQQVAVGAVFEQSAVAAPKWPVIKPIEVVSFYAAAGDEADETKRRELLEKAWTDDGVYTDPTVHVEGREALIKHIAGFLNQMGEARLERSSGVEVHHNVLRFEWRILAPDGTIVAVGFDYGELAEDGRLRKIVGFFGPFPELE